LLNQLAAVLVTGNRGLVLADSRDQVLGSLPPEVKAQVRFVGRSMTMTGPVTAVVSGDLTAKGVTRPTTLAVSFTAPPAKASGREAIRLSGRARIDRTEFGMTAYRLIVAKSVTISIDTQMVPA